MNANPVVIVAGDAPDSRAIIANMLVAEPCHIVEAAEGGTVLDLVTRKTGDLVLMETYMRDVDGLEVCRRLRKDTDNRLLPIVLISAMDDMASRVAAIDAGADDFLSKPLERNELIARVRSLLKMKTMRDRLEDARQVIFALANAAEAKDLYTVQHTQRGADSASALARSLGLPPEVVDEIRVGGLIHDVGKLAIPDAVLNKPGPLTSAEFELIKTHTVVGAEIVAPLASQRHVVGIVRSHHERFDGAGYPDGLAGEDIPLGARIVSVCDSYDAMVNVRPYRGAVTHAEAVTRLHAGRGTQWDGRMVDALVAMYAPVVGLSNGSVTTGVASLGSVAMERKIRILIADDHAEVLAAARDLIGELDDVDVVSITRNVDEAVSAALRFQPDIAFVDAWLHGGGAELATKRIKAVSPQTRVFALASASERDTVDRLRAAGAVDCYDKERLSAVLPGILAAAHR